MLHLGGLPPAMPGAKARFVARRFALRGGGLPGGLSQLRRDRYRRQPAAEHGDADDADVVRASGPRRVRVGQRREVERRGLGEALAPAQNVIGAARAEHIAGLPRIGALAADHVHAVDRYHGQHVFAQPVAHRDLVFVARSSDDVCPAFVPVHREAPSFGAVINGKIHQAAMRSHLGSAQHCQQRNHGSRIHFLSFL